MSKSPFWGTVTRVLVPIYILQALNMRTCLNQLTMSSVTYFISQAKRGNSLQPRLTQLKSMERIWKNEGEWTREAKIGTRKKLWHWLSIRGYILTYSVLLRENICQLWVIVQELCESWGGRPGLSVLTNLLVSVDVKIYWTVLRHWSQLVPNMSTDIWGH